jgi:hypothetical protein
VPDIGGLPFFPFAIAIYTSPLHRVEDGKAFTVLVCFLGTMVPIISYSLPEAYAADAFKF